MAKGTVARVFSDRGFGFIKQDDGGPDVFFRVNWVRGVAASAVHQGLRVEYETEQTPQGLRTRTIRAVGEASHGPASGSEDESGQLYRFFNPYNFVRFIDQQRPRNNILGDCPPPPHDRYIGLSGRIICRVEVVTPLFVADAHAVENKDGHKSYRFFQLEDENGKHQPALPATSLRGVVRSVFETITNSCLIAFDGGRFDLREGRLPRDLVPARVLKIDKNGAELELFDCSKMASPVNCSRKPATMGTGMVSAYTPKVLKRKGNSWVPFTSGGKFGGAKAGERVAALVRTKRQVHKTGRFQWFPVVEVVPASRHTTLTPGAGQRKVFGYLHITGPNIENKHNERLFFRWDDTDPTPQKTYTPKIITVDEKTVEEYNHSLKAYWERNQRQIDKLNKKGIPWPTTKDDLPHPSYFIQKNGKLQAGDLVYCIPQSNLGILVLRPILISRLPYQFDRADLLPKHLHRCKKYNALCPACRTFGWVHENAAELGKKEEVAYAGRVRFSHAAPVGQIEQDPNPITLAILGSPKPTKTQFYLLGQNGKPNPNVTYNHQKAKLRGRKFYRHHGSQPSRHATDFEYRRVGNTQDDQNRTVRGVVTAGTFKFTLDFENLAPLELGALLWALDLGPDMYHRLGYAKPLGFGSVKISVTDLETINWQARLASLDEKAGWEDKKAHILSLQEDFLNEMNQQYGKAFQITLAELSTILSEPDSVTRIHYPRPGKEPTAEGRNFEWFMKHKEQTLGLATEDEGLSM